MALLISIEDLKTHIYGEYVEEITRADDEITTSAIERAIAQAKGYASRYDLTKLFGTELVDPEIQDAQLKGIVKDLAAWHLIQLSNPNIEMNRLQAAYEYAMSWLKDLQKGMVVPEGWPYHDSSTDPELPDGNDVEWSSNCKRHNHF